MVKGIKFQNDLPKSTDTCAGVRPIASAATTTTSTAMAANT